MPLLRIDVFADIACPWCYIGDKRLEAALARREDLRAERRWRPFQLQPDLPPEGLPWRAFAEEKFGGLHRAAAMFEQVATLGAAEGCLFDFERVATAPNTLDAHRLVLLAERLGLGPEMAERLFRAYFGEGARLNDPAELVRLASEVGIKAEIAARYLESDDGAEAVRESGRTAAQFGIRGVPFYILHGRLGISGAQSAEVFEQAIEQALQETQRGA